VQDNCNEKIEFTLPDSLITEVDTIVQMENSNREDFAKAAFQFYITQKKRIFSKESMKAGYTEMGQINLSLAELGMTIEVLSSDEKDEGEIAKGEY
jgi:CopG family transcriptional regulator/antitoxin EndoAI